MDDSQLLEHYLRDGSHAAFRELVSRHCGLVHGVALRVTRCADLARDVSQLVFLKLAKRPPWVTSTPLAAWLHRVTRCTAIDVVRQEEARRKREALLALEQPMHPQPEPSWEEISPLVDGIIDTLPEIERRAVILRYFEKCSYREIAKKLDLGEEAARKRVDRALQRMRDGLARKDIHTSAGALAAALPARMVGSPPEGLAAAICGSLQGTGISSFTLITHTLLMTKKGMLALAAVIGLTGTSAVILHNASDESRPEDMSTRDRSTALLSGSDGSSAAGLERDARGTRRNLAAVTPTSGSTMNSDRQAEIDAMVARFGEAKAKRARALAARSVEMMDQMAQAMERMGRPGLLIEGVLRDAESLQLESGEKLVLTPDQKDELGKLVDKFHAANVDSVKQAAERGRKAPGLLEEYFLLNDARKGGSLAREDFEKAWPDVSTAMDFQAFLTNDGGSLWESPAFLDQSRQILTSDQHAAVSAAKGNPQIDAEDRNQPPDDATLKTIEESEDRIHESLKGVKAFMTLMDVQGFFGN